MPIMVKIGGKTLAYFSLQNLRPHTIVVFLLSMVTLSGAPPALASMTKIFECVANHPESDIRVLSGRKCRSVYYIHALVSTYGDTSVLWLLGAASPKRPFTCGKQLNGFRAGK